VPVAGRGTTAPRPPPKVLPKRANRLIVIDAGHGGVDNGMSGPVVRGRRFYEKDVTLAIARRLADMLRDEGFSVLLTRDADTLIALDDRGRIANDRHGDLFVSIHVNAANVRWKNPTAARGFETYFLSEARTEDAKRVEEMENEAVRFETAANAGKDDDLGFIINDMAQNEHLRESSEIAETVQRALARAHPGPSRGVKQAGFRVLVRAYMPAVLVEVGFGTNPDEAEFLMDPNGQRTLARALTSATLEYMDHYEKRVGSGR
jgi:N-acetylmuramoyl-L-alanine amidase